jgi:hypothetical protein
VADNEPELGRQMHSRCLVLRGALTLRKWRAFLVACAKAMGMEPAGAAAHWKYPTVGGKGGVGHTLCQPITESFLVIDTWEKFDGAYLFIASCRKFAISRVTETALRFGLDVDDIAAPATLRLGQ